ncbi:hypothetical protein AB0395_45565 [Streptosporangium sp. NPDC051023]|uniref:hypothetical protein n=1 Tax=Streptosporangium sp. NPDC051023 TaxID=3155410 RepID=UPI00344C94A0
MNDDEIKAIVPAYEAACEAALQERDATLRRAIAEGHKQVDLIKLTGLSRETIRQALDPAAREAVRQAAVERRAARKAQQKP